MGQWKFNRTLFFYYIFLDQMRGLMRNWVKRPVRDNVMLYIWGGDWWFPPAQGELPHEAPQIPKH